MNKTSNIRMNQVNKKLFFICITLLVFITLASSVYALTLEEYVSNLDTSYYDGTLNVTLFSDALVDTNTNAIPDTLFINLTTNHNTPGNYTALLFFTDKKLPILSDSRFIGPSSSKFLFNVSSHLLSEQNYSYFVRIQDAVGRRVYESNKVYTNNYASYESGTNVSSIVVSNANNNTIAVNLTLNVVRNETANVSVLLQYNDSIVIGSSNISLITPQTSILIHINNESIKSTRVKGNFTILSIRVGEKKIEINQSTQYFDYENFAKSSYINDVMLFSTDFNENNLTDNVVINATLTAKSEGNYTLTGDLYSSAGKYVASFYKSEYLSEGVHLITAQINGTTMYKSRVDGPYLISSITLRQDNSTVDSLQDVGLLSVTTYRVFERPLLPNLNVTMTVSGFPYNYTLNVTVFNNGAIEALNVFVDIFDNESYANTSSTNVINVGEQDHFIFNVSTTAHNDSFMAMVDFYNLVDESNESDNFATTFRTPTPLLVSNLSHMLVNGTEHVLRFEIENLGELTLDNITWTLDTGNGNKSSQYNTTLTSGEDIWVYVYHNYTSAGTYNVTATASNGQYEDSETIEVTV